MSPNTYNLPNYKESLKRKKERLENTYMLYRLLFLRNFGYKTLRYLDTKDKDKGTKG